MTKKIIPNIIIILLIPVILSASSKLKYEDVYKVVLSGDKENAYTMLLAYQKQDPDFANVYFQLGLIAEDWAFEFNPYTEFYYTKLFIYNTKLYFNLAKLYLKDEKNKNRSYYKNAPVIPKGKKLQIEDINQYIDSQVEKIKDYEKHVIKIINLYNKSSDSYNECVSTFMKINSDYAKIKNIYLSDDKQLEKDMTKLKSDFDSTLIYFKKYKTALAEYPLNRYNQNYRLKDIITYRLDGLTYSGFLNDDILLWNYGKWVENVRNIKETVIKNNREEIFKQDKQIKQKIKALEYGEYFDDYAHFKLDNKFIYKIEKFDNNSLLIKLFKLNEAKINFLELFKKSINNPATITCCPIIKRAAYCINLNKQKKYADSINNIFINAIKPEEIKKYKTFYISEYDGLKGLKEYSFRQSLFFDAKQKDAMLNLKKHLYFTAFKINTDSLSYNNTPFQTQVTSPETNNNEPGKYYITDFKNTKEGTIWISGYTISENNKMQGYTAFSEDNKNIKFLSLNEKNDTANTCNLIIAPYKKGCYAVKTTKGTQINNTLVKYDNNGKIILSLNLPYHKIPRIIKYDDINNNIIIIFGGYKMNKISDDNKQIIYHLNPDDQLRTYEIKINAKIQFFDIVKRNKKLYLFGNFINFEDLSGNTVYSKAGTSENKTNILVTIINNGMIEKQIPFFDTQPVFGVKALKINSNTINILGYKTELKEQNFENLKTKELYYRLINPEGEKINSAWHD
ncbi:MAG: hypothetical protein GXO50_10405 [Chlorobi bacterium]|nr:hypothetical protein [Chlorobiota bacterium]